MDWRFNTDATLLVTIVIPTEYNQIKSTMTSDLMFFRALFRLETWLLLSSINFFILLLFIKTMMLQSIPQGNIMEMGRGYDNMISCTKAVSVSTSCKRC